MSASPTDLPSDSPADSPPGSSPPAAGVRERLDAAVRFARTAGALTLEGFRERRFRVERKSDGSDVTEVDRAAEALLREEISAAFPDDAILGEEQADRPGSSAFRWIIDPIDGTKSFVHGVPLYGTLVGVERAGEPVAGVIRMPALDEEAWGGPGLGAWHVRGDEPAVPARVTGTAALADSMVLATAWDYFFDEGREAALPVLMGAIGHMRGWSDCYAHLLLVTGRADAVVEPILCPWDIAAVMPIVEAAGGRCTDWRGARAIYPSAALVSNGRIHDELTTALAPLAAD